MAGDVKIKVGGTKLGGRSVSGREIAASLTGTIGRGVTKLRAPLQETMLAVFDSLKRKHGQQWAPTGLFGTRGITRLRTRSGTGLRSIRDSIKVTGDGKGGMVGTIGAGTMGIHVTGATVTPKGSKYLAIPTVNALTPTGQNTRAPRSFQKTFVKKSRKGNLFIFQRKGRGKGAYIVPLFLLKKSVKIPPRLDLMGALRDRSTYFERKAYAALVREL